MASCELLPSHIAKHHTFLLVELIHGRHWDSITLQEPLKLGNSVVFAHPQLGHFGLKVCILLLEMNDGLISLIQSSCQPNHDAPLLQ